MASPASTEKSAKYTSNIDHGVSTGKGLKTSKKQKRHSSHLIDEGLPGAGDAEGFDPDASSERERYSGVKHIPGTAYNAPVGEKRFDHAKLEDGSDDNSSHLVQISERQLSWPRAAILLFTEYVVLAILAFPYSFQVLGMAGGVLASVVIGLSTLYTSHVLWRYCMLNPQVRDICDVAYYLCGKSRVAWLAAFIGLALNNVFIMGLHCNAGTTAINTLNYTFCSTIWGVILAIIMFFGSLIRDFKHATILGVVSALTMFCAYLIVVIGHNVQGLPNGYVADPASNVSWTVWAPEGTTFVQGVSALLNIAYTYIGQALIPSFVGDMAKPEDFPKALYCSMFLELILFTTCGALVYMHTGVELTTAPAYGTLIAKYGRPAAAMVLPTIIIVGILYSLVTSRAIFFQFYNEKSIHRRQHTVKGWASWIAIVFVLWAIAFVIAESIPFFSDLLSLISSLFDSWFGYIMWGCAWFVMNKNRTRKGPWYYLEFGLNIVMIIVGFFFFGAGTYAAVQSIINSYATGSIKTPFTCVNTGFLFTR